MSPDDLTSVEETISVLFDAAVMSEVRQAEAAVARDEVTPLSDLLRSRIEERP